MFTKNNTRGGKMNGCGSLAGKMGKRNQGILREDIGLQTCGNNTAGVASNAQVAFENVRKRLKSGAKRLKIFEK